MRAVDQAGNLSPYSTIATATTPAAPDTTAPSTPSGLTATAASATQINLSWTASNDNVGVTGYRVERCTGATCTIFTQVGTPTGTTFNDTGLTPSTTYRYQVRAVDQAGNLSPYSTIATATTPAAPDTTAPSTPSGLTAHRRPARPRSTSAGPPPHDNVGVTGYRVERCTGATCTIFTQVGTPTSTTFNDTGLHALDHLPLPGARRRPGRQPQPLLHDRHRHHPRRTRHHASKRSRDRACCRVSRLGERDRLRRRD